MITSLEIRKCKSLNRFHYRQTLALQRLTFMFQLYFFTVEFGLCRQTDGSFRVYGAGLLSSVAELQHALVTPEKIKRFDPEVTINEECIITSYQNAYYYTDSFEEAKEKMRFALFFKYTQWHVKLLR